MTDMPSMRTAAHVRKLAGREREQNDFYRTPMGATRALLEVESFPTSIWEPACGDGAISRVLESRGHKVTSTDLIDRKFGTPRRDFLLEQELLAPAIITNPPFKLADEFTLHALELGAEKIAMFGRIAFLEGVARHRRLWSAHPPSRVWIFSNRLTLWRGDDPDPKDKGGAIAFAWFVWESGHAGVPRLGWLDSREPLTLAKAA